jgi:trimeric autotransporter adhesin
VKFTLRISALILCALACASAQQSSMPAATTAPNTPIPSLINFSGVLTDPNRKPLAGAGVTFFLYRESQGGAPLWMETQTVHSDNTGHYSVILGATTSRGLPPDLFASGEARWLGVQVAGQEEQPRVLLVAVPYAMKAGDAETVGGFPASAFMLAPPVSGASSTISPAPPASTPAQAPPPATVTGSGTKNTVPLWTGATTLGNSALSQSGAGATAKVGINTTAPATTLDVKGTETVRGVLTLPALAPATAAKGANSQPLNLAASVFNSGTGTAVNQNFRWQAEPVANNTANAAGSLSLLYAPGSNNPAETGLKISNKGILAFAAGQIFSGNGSALSNVNANELGGAAASAFARIASANNFSQAQTITAPTSATFGLKASVANASGTAAIITNTAGGNLISARIGGGAGNEVFSVDSSGDIFNSGIIVAANDINTSGNFFGNGMQITGTVILGSTTATGVTLSDGSGSNGVVATGGSAPTLMKGAGSGIIATGGSGQLYSNGTGPSVGGFFTGGDVPNCAGDGGGGDGIISRPGVGEQGAGVSGAAGEFFGDVFVEGKVSSDAVNFRIDHPADPANQYLEHAAVGSSELMNLYTGNVTTNANGEAKVELPAWFETLNADFRYQLTVIGQFAQAIVSREISGHEFAIRTTVPNVKVSWLVTAIRHDAYATANPLVVEKKKDARERGFYLHPELYGAPRTKGIEWARHPQLMKQTEQRPAAATQPLAARPPAKTATSGPVSPQK